MNGLLQANDLSLGYGARVVFEGISFEIAAGEFWFVVGPNGAGKSTLLNACLGLLKPLRGTLQRSRELHGRRHVALVPQGCDLNRSLSVSVREFVGLGFVGLGLDRRTRAERLSWALERVDLPGFERRSYWSLSGGQRQRALVARALVRKPKLILLDEPTSGLDLNGSEKLLASLDELHSRDGLSLLFVTHRLDVALRHGTHFVLCGDSTIHSGSAREVFTDENLAAAYGPHVSVVETERGDLSLRLDPGAPGA